MTLRADAQATQEPLQQELSSPADFHTNALIHICVVQAFIRGAFQRAEFQRKRDAALAVQSMLYSVDEDNRMKLELQERQAAAAKLQKIWRRRRYIKHCKVIQSCLRASQTSVASGAVLADIKKAAATDNNDAVLTDFNEAALASNNNNHDPKRYCCQFQFK
jgi:hypothetical protein